MRMWTLLVGIISSICLAQTVVEDFKCASPTAATNANPVVFTCSAAHGFASMPAAGFVNVAAVPSDGDTLTINGVVYTWKTTITDGNPREIRIVSAAEMGGSTTNARYANGFALAATINNEAVNGRHAVRNTGSWGAYTFHTTSGRDWSSATSQNADVEALAFDFWVFLQYRAAGGHGTAISETGTSMVLYDQDRVTVSTSLKTQWRVQIEGGTGNWAGVNRTRAGFVSWMATYQSSTTFSIPVNSAGYGTFSGQALTVWRTTAEHRPIIQPHNDLNWYAEFDGVTISDGEIQVPVPDCTLGVTPEITCARSYAHPFSNKSYGNYARIANLVVSGASATVTLAAPFTTGQDLDTLAVNGACIYIYGYRAYSTATNPGYDGSANDPAQDAAKWFMRPAQGLGGREDSTTVRCFYPTAVASTTSFTIANPGLVDGTYIGSCPTNGGGAGECPANGVVGQGVAWIVPRVDPSVYIRWGLTGSNVTYTPWDHPHRRTKGGVPSAPNRLVTWARLDGRNLNRRTGNGYDTTIGTYTLAPAEKVGTSGGAHFYHTLSTALYDGSWKKIVITNTPDHQVNAAGGKTWPSNPTCGHGYTPGFKGDFAGGVPCDGYLSLQQTMYIDWGGAYRRQSNPDNKGFAGGTMRYAKMQFDSVANEPDDYVRGIMGQWSANRYVTGVLTASPGVEVEWSGTPTGHVAGDTNYEVRYSTSQSLKTLGWSNGTTGGAISSPSIGYTTRVWQSPEMSNPANIWVGIRPTVRVWGTSRSGQDIWVITGASIGVGASDTVTVSGVGGNTAANQTGAAVAAVRAAQVWHRFRPQVSGAWTTPHTLTSIATDGTASTCTVALTVNHNIVPGWVIEVIGTTSGTLGNTPVGDAAPKVYRVTSTPSASTMTFACPAGLPINTTYNTNGAVNMAVVAYPGIRLPGTSNADFTSGGTVVATSETAHFSEFSLSSTDPNGAVALGVTTSSLSNGQLGQAYSATLSATGGTAPYTWDLSAGTLPTGLSLSSGGVISGTPSAGTGTTNITVRATDAVAATATRALSITLAAAAPALSITAPGDQSGVLGIPYTNSWAVAGGTAPYTCSITVGSLPSWATLATLAGSCVITGTPDAAATSNITVRATDAVAATADSASSIVISSPANPDPIAITGPTPAALTMTVDQSGSVVWHISGGTPPYTCAVIGTLPTGLSLTASTCTVSGTPTVLGNVDISMQVTDSGTPALVTYDVSSIFRVVGGSGITTIGVVSARGTSGILRVAKSGMDANVPCPWVVRVGETFEHTVSTGTIPAGPATRRAAVVLAAGELNRVDVRCGGISNSVYVTPVSLSGSSSTTWKGSHATAADALVEWGTDGVTFGSSAVAPCVATRCTVSLSAVPTTGVVYVRHTWRDGGGSTIAAGKAQVIRP